MDIPAAVLRYFGTGSTMSVLNEQSATGLVISLAGSLDRENSRALQLLLEWIIDNQASRFDLVIDLENVDYISSTGVGALSNALMAARKRGTGLRLRSLQAKVRAVFVLLGLMEYFEEVRNVI